MEPFRGEERGFDLALPASQLVAAAAPRQKFVEVIHPPLDALVGLAAATANADANRIAASGAPFDRR